MSEYINIVDSFNLTIPTRKLTDEGYLQANAALTKVGVQQYDLSNITGKKEDSGKIVNVFRPKETVFHEKTIESAKMKPITMNHPHENVNSSNHYNYSVGIIGERVNKLDDERLGANIQITDKDIVNDVMSNKLKELSCGYDAKIIPKIGNYNDISYEYEFSGAMIMNHCAIVDKGRCGESVSILDKKEENLLMSEQNIDKNPEIQDESINEEMENSIIVEDKDMSDYDKMKKSLLEDESFIGSLVDKLKKKNGMKDSEETETESSINDEEIKNEEKTFKDEVNFRVNLIDKAKKLIIDENITDLSNREILEKSLSKSNVNIKDKSDDYLLGVLDSLVKDHEEAKKYFDENHKNEMTNHSPRYFGATDIRKL
jgi:hypothetical protein